MTANFNSFLFVKTTTVCLSLIVPYSALIDTTKVFVFFCQYFSLVLQYSYLNIVLFEFKSCFFKKSLCLKQDKISFNGVRKIREKIIFLTPFFLVLRLNSLKAAVRKFGLFVAISVWKPGTAAVCGIISLVWDVLRLGSQSPHRCGYLLYFTITDSSLHLRPHLH